ncbi:hypothetical protein LCGC14_0686580 [marine sediment metagenome]|uniref:Uncharacterized protein n=1 Tax=marine sediment metagenome TaxID=412755 RepID=A0A0F9T7W3_9ZZZZ
MKIIYKSKSFNNSTKTLIGQAEEIITEYQAQGFILTLRQLYYQFVARGYIENTERSYKRIGNITSDARRAGLIDWDAIEDRTRHLRRLSSWDSPQAILESAADDYHRDLWATQPIVVEVWIEKDALVGVIEDVCQRFDVPFFSCRGYVSDSEIWRAGVRAMPRDNKQHKDTIIYHLGDHDPSGIDMTRDIEERLALFSFNSPIEVRRLALNMPQIEEFNPPPNPAKITDSRFRGYSNKYGDESWELDALEPQYIVDLITDNLNNDLDHALFSEIIEKQEEERKELRALIRHLGK